MSEYDWLSLDQDEEVLWSGQPRKMSIVPAIVAGVIMIPLFGIGLLIIASAYLTLENTDFVVTSDGLYKKTGIISRNVQKIGFDKVQNISFSQGVLGKHFDYGNVEISTAGGSGIEMSFNSIEDPKNVQELINSQIRSGGTAEGEMTEKEILMKIWGELDSIREHLENL